MINNIKIAEALTIGQIKNHLDCMQDILTIPKVWISNIIDSTDSFINELSNENKLIMLQLEQYKEENKILRQALSEYQNLPNDYDGIDKLIDLVNKHAELLESDELEENNE